MPTAGLCFADSFLFLTVALSFDNGRTDCNADFCVNTVDEKNTTAINLVTWVQ